MWRIGGFTVIILATGDVLRDTAVADAEFLRFATVTAGDRAAAIVSHGREGGVGEVDRDRPEKLLNPSKSGDGK